MKAEILKLLRKLPQPTPEQKEQRYTGNYAASADLIVTMQKEIQSGNYNSGWIVNDPRTYIAQRLISDCNWTKKAANKLQSLLKN